MHYIQGITWTKKAAEEKKLIISDDLYKKIQSGEADPLVENCVYRYQMKNNEVSYIVLDVYDGNMANDFIENSGDVHERAIGTVLERDGGYIKVQVEEQELVWRTADFKVLIVYDSINQEFLQGNLNDIRAGDRIYIYGSIKSANAILIIH